MLEAEEEAPEPQWVEHNEELEQEFENFWQDNGEQLVLAKWKEKYGDFMETENLNDIEQQKTQDDGHNVGTWIPNDSSSKSLDCSGDTLGGLKNNLDANRKEIMTSDVNSSGWGDAIASSATAAVCKSTWGESPNVSNGNWGSIDKPVYKDSNLTVYNDGNITFSDGCQISSSNAFNDENSVNAVPDQEQWNILWQKMWQTTRMTHYCDFMIKKAKSKHLNGSKRNKSTTSNKNKKNTLENKNNDNSTDNNLEETHLNSSNTATEYKNEVAENDGTRFNRKNTGLALLVQSLKQPSPDKDKSNKSDSEADNPEICISEENQSECDNERPDELPSYVTRSGYEDDASILSK